MRGTKEPLVSGTGSLRAAALVFSAYLLPSCIHQNMAPDTMHPAEEVRSGWHGGSCGLSSGRLWYSESASGRQASLALDARVGRNVRELSCSEEFTVVIEKDAAVISLGANGVLGNLDSLGCYGGEGLGCSGGRFISANSIQVSFEGISREDGGLVGRAVEGDSLTLRTERGRTWSLALANPFAGWSIY